jgi:hypothetical protein
MKLSTVLPKLRSLRFVAQKHKRISVFVLNLCIAVLFLCHLAIHRQGQRFAGYDDVVRAAQSGQLRADPEGDIELPSDLKWLTPEGHVYEIRIGGHGVHWLFLTSVTWHHNLQPNGICKDTRQISGYVYSSGLSKLSYLSFKNVVEVRTSDLETMSDSHWRYAEPVGF